jgi:hypothetical protein
LKGKKQKKRGKVCAELSQIHVLVEEITNTKFKSFGEEEGLNTHTHTHTHTHTCNRLLVVVVVVVLVLAASGK